MPERYGPAPLLASAPPPRCIPALLGPARLGEPALAAADGATQRAQPRIRADRDGGPQVRPAAPHPGPGGSPGRALRSPPPLASPAELGAPGRIK